MSYHQLTLDSFSTAVRARLVIPSSSVALSRVSQDGDAKVGGDAVGSVVVFGCGPCPSTLFIDTSTQCLRNEHTLNLKPLKSRPNLEARPDIHSIGGDPALRVWQNQSRDSNVEYLADIGPPIARARQCPGYGVIQHVNFIAGFVGSLGFVM